MYDLSQCSFCFLIQWNDLWVHSLCYNCFSILLPKDDIKMMQQIDFYTGSNNCTWAPRLALNEILEVIFIANNGTEQNTQKYLWDTYFTISWKSVMNIWFRDFDFFLINFKYVSMIEYILWKCISTYEIILGNGKKKKNSEKPFGSLKEWCLRYIALSLEIKH